MPNALIAVIIIALLVLAAALILIIVLLKRDIKNLDKDLKTICKSDTNLRLTSLTFDKDICTLENSINNLLDKQQQISLQSQKLNNEIRMAVTNISHDLRTPLTSALGYIQMLRQDNISEPKKQEYIATIEKRMTVLTELLDGLLEFSLILEGKTTTKLQKLNITNALRDTLSLYYDDFIKAGFSMTTDIPDEPSYTICDGEMLGRVFRNLIKNILVHGNKKAQISFDPTTKTALFENDISPTDASSLNADNLFDRFYTSDLSRTKASAGLGLAIVKELSASIGISVTAELKENILSIKVKF